MNLTKRSFIKSLVIAAAAVFSPMRLSQSSIDLIDLVGEESANAMLDDVIAPTSGYIEIRNGKGEILAEQYIGISKGEILFDRKPVVLDVKKSGEAYEARIYDKNKQLWVTAPLEMITDRPAFEGSMITVDSIKISY